MIFSRLQGKFSQSSSNPAGRFDVRAISFQNIFHFELLYGAIVRTKVWVDRFWANPDAGYTWVAVSFEAFEEIDDVLGLERAIVSTPWGTTADAYLSENRLSAGSRKTLAISRERGR